MLARSDINNIVYFLGKSTYEGLHEAEMGLHLRQKLIDMIHAIDNPKGKEDGGDVQATD